MNERNEGEGKKKSFDLMVQGDGIIHANLSNPKSNHNSKLKIIILSIVKD
jgi:hypothetical protein